jgi:hypothetical protein
MTGAIFLFSDSQVADALRETKLADWRAPASKNPSNGPSNGELVALATTPQTVAPDAAQRKSGAQFQPQSRPQ